jgi:hypothetical protein
MSIVPSASTPLVPVPIPDHIAALIGSCLPLHVLQAEVDVDSEAREFGRFHAPSGTAQFDSEDRADRELSMSRIRRANKVLAAYSPRLILKAGGSR